MMKLGTAYAKLLCVIVLCLCWDLTASADVFDWEISKGNNPGIKQRFLGLFALNLSFTLVA